MVIINQKLLFLSNFQGSYCLWPLISTRVCSPSTHKNADYSKHCHSKCLFNLGISQALSASFGNNQMCYFCAASYFKLFFAAESQVKVAIKLMETGEHNSRRKAHTLVHQLSSRCAQPEMEERRHLIHRE